METQKNMKEGMLPIGATLQMGKYRIDGYLGSGGFGNTYKTTHLLLNEVVAIKEFYIRGISTRNETTAHVTVSNADNKDTFEVQREKMKKEARRLRLLNNPHIVHVSDLFEENGTVYYVMDYINGKSLYEMLGERGALPEEKVWKYFEQMLDALEEVHRNSIYHLDVKPENILIDEKDNVVLIDFGASKLIKPGAKGLEKTQIAYTNGYAAMELMEKNEDKIGPFTDLYSLGATLYSLLTNKKPPMPSDIYGAIAMAGKGKTLSTTEQCHVAFPLLDNYSERMRYLVYWLMQTIAVVRPQNVEEVRQWMANGQGGNNDNSTSYTENTIHADNSPQDESTVLYDNSDDSYSIPEPEEDDEYEEEETFVSKKKSHIVDFLLGLVVSIFVMVIVWFLFFRNGGITSPEQESFLSDSIAQNYEITNEFIGNYLYTGEVDRRGNPHGEGEAFFIDESGHKNGKSFRGKFIHGYFIIENPMLGEYKYYGQLDNQGNPHAPRGRAEFLNENGNPDGRTYVGGFNHGVLEGDSVVFNWNADIFEGSFRDNRFYEGTYTDNTNNPKGNYFVGTFHEGQPKRGSWFNKNGKVIRKVG